MRLSSWLSAWMNLLKLHSSHRKKNLKNTDTQLDSGSTVHNRFSSLCEYTKHLYYTATYLRSNQNRGLFFEKTWRFARRKQLRRLRNNNHNKNINETLKVSRTCNHRQLASYDERISFKNLLVSTTVAATATTLCRVLLHNNTVLW